jgi:predicted dehydrogenase
MERVGVGIIGTGWCAGIRAETCAASPLTASLHLAEVRPERLAEVAKATGAKTAGADYRALLGDEVDAVQRSARAASTCARSTGARAAPRPRTSSG